MLISKSNLEITTTETISIDGDLTREAATVMLNYELTLCEAIELFLRYIAEAKKLPLSLQEIVRCSLPYKYSTGGKPAVEAADEGFFTARARKHVDQKIIEEDYGSVSQLLKQEKFLWIDRDGKPEAVMMTFKFFEDGLEHPLIKEIWNRSMLLRGKNHRPTSKEPKH